MADKNHNNQTSKLQLPSINISKDGLALVVGGVFILSLVFATYNYFNKSSKEFEKVQKETQQVFETEKQEQEEGNLTEESTGDLNGMGTSTFTKVSQIDLVSNSESTWIANNYEDGDIKGASYTVVTGDTLWEIAEAAYGDGTAWTKVLEANKSNIGFLPNGQQALIIPGQVLVLP